MPEVLEKVTIGTIQAKVVPERQVDFVNWQGNLNAQVASFSGFLSLEILNDGEPNKWMIVQRFTDADSLSAWRKSSIHKNLIKELEKLTAGDVKEGNRNISDLKCGVTEVFVTQVNEGKEDLFKKWIAKIHQAEAKFPGFRGTYVQSPEARKGKNWITLLQFDTPENLDRWLSSKERENVLRESTTLINSLENHRVISPYAGWFASIAKTGQIPPIWKQTMLILLVLFPIVMLEMKYLNPLLKGLNLSLGTFIGNAISVSLVSWPLLPFAIRSLKWWLIPEPSQKMQITIKGTLLVLFLYFLEVVILWNLI